MNKIIYLSTIIALASSLLHVETSAQTIKPDSLHRELTLERDFIPTQDQVQKAFFSPLSTQKKGMLKALDFVKDAYSITSKIEHRVFDPVYNDRLPEVMHQKGYVRLYGGIPGVGGINSGIHFTPATDKHIGAYLNHLTRHYLGRNTLPAPLKTITTHDTDLTLTYAQKLDLSTFNAKIQGVYDVERLYGSHNGMKSPISFRDYNFKPPYPMVHNYGAILSGGKSYAPIFEGSPWHIQSEVTTSYIVKTDPAYTGQELAPRYTGKETMPTTEARLSINGDVAYEITDQWQIHTRPCLDLQAYSPQVGNLSLHNTLLVGLRPTIEYKEDIFTAQLGAHLQHSSRSSSRFIIAPSVHLRLRPIETLSIFATADGGATARHLREVYLENKYSFGASISDAVQYTKYRLLAGIEVGSLSGLSIKIHGGYAHHQDFLDWQQRELYTDLGTDLYLPLYTYDLYRRSDVRHIFAGVSTRYLSPIGLQLSGSVQYNAYKTSDLKDADGISAPIRGLPKIQINASAVYDITSRLSLQASYAGLWGIRFEDVAEPARQVRTMSNELNAQLTYSLSSKFGISLIGTNILNMRNDRWRHYEHTGSSLLGVLTFTF